MAIGLVSFLRVGWKGNAHPTLSFAVEHHRIERQRYEKNADEEEKNQNRRR